MDVETLIAELRTAAWNAESLESEVEDESTNAADKLRKGVALLRSAANEIEANPGGNANG